MNAKHTRRLQEKREQLSDDYNKQFNPTGDTLVLRIGKKSNRELVRIPIPKSLIKELKPLLELRKQENNLSKETIRNLERGDKKKVAESQQKLSGVQTWKKPWKDFFAFFDVWLDAQPLKLRRKIAKEPGFVWRLMFNLDKLFSTR